MPACTGRLFDCLSGFNAAARQEPDGATIVWITSTENKHAVLRVNQYNTNDLRTTTSDRVRGPALGQHVVRPTNPAVQVVQRCRWCKLHH